MATSDIAYSVATNPTFMGRVHYFALKAAIAVVNESDATAHHSERVRLANKVIRGNLDQNVLPRLVVTNATVAATIAAEEEPTGVTVPDGDLEFVVNSVWDALALAY